MSEKAQESYSPIDWPNWQPDEYATLGFVTAKDHVLLIRKQRGLGAGKITGPGGRLDPGESPEECVIRELKEELILDILNPKKAGELWFQFTDGYKLLVYVYVITEYHGEPQATEEAVPLWSHYDQIPFEEMWADDELWFPLMRKGQYFVGRFLFDSDRLVNGHISES